MTEPVKKTRKKAPKRTYINRPNAVCVTIHSPDGSPVPRSVLNAAADSITQIALDNGLLINLAEV